MLVLLIRKPTNLELHQEMALRGEVPEQVDPAYMRMMSLTHKEHYACLEHLQTSLEAQGIRRFEATRGQEWPKGPFDYIISLGGDGTLITASYGIKDATPLIGIRSSSSSVGYLCAADIHSLDALVVAMAEQKLSFLNRHRLVAKIQQEKGGQIVSPYMALNDFLFAASSPAATTRYRLRHNDRDETHKSSGIWISTASGSSAAIGASGGSLMAIEDPRFQFLVREHYRKIEDQMQLSHGFTDPERDRFEIESLCPSAILALDGEKWVSTIAFGDKITFQAAIPVRVAKSLSSAR